MSVLEWAECLMLRWSIPLVFPHEIRICITSVAFDAHGTREVPLHRSGVWNGTGVLYCTAMHRDIDSSCSEALLFHVSAELVKSPATNFIPPAQPTSQPPPRLAYVTQFAHVPSLAHHKNPPRPRPSFLLHHQLVIYIPTFSWLR